MIQITFHLPDVRAADIHYRAISPVLRCHHELRKEGIELQARNSLDFQALSNVYVFHRIIQPPFIPVVRELKEKGCTIVYSLDDLLPEVRPCNPMYHCVGPAERAAFVAMIGLADWVIASTEALGGALAAYGAEAGRVLIAPNLLDLADWPSLGQVPEGPRRILWAGGDSHGEDLMECMSAVDRILDRYGDAVQMLWMGSMPDDFAEIRANAGNNLGYVGPRLYHRRPWSWYGRRMGFIPAVPLAEYPAALAEIRPYIALCPLAANAWNRCKSAVKYLEMTAAGAAVVATDFGPYCGTESVLVGPDDPDGWFLGLDYLLENPAGVQALHGWASDDLHLNHTWGVLACRQKWLDVFRTIAKRP